jgi:hypothetical protein
VPAHTWEQCITKHPETCSLSHDGHEHPELYLNPPPIAVHSWASCGSRANCPLSQSGHGPRIDDPPSLHHVVAELHSTIDELNKSNTQLQQINIRQAALIRALSVEAVSRAVPKAGA